MNGLEDLSSEEASLLLSLEYPGLICCANRQGITTPENDANPPSATRRGDFFFALSSLSKLADLPKKKPAPHRSGFLRFKWSHLGSNQGPTDYESATLTN